MGQGRFPLSVFYISLKINKYNMCTSIIYFKEPINKHSSSPSVQKFENILVAIVRIQLDRTGPFTIFRLGLDRAGYIYICIGISTTYGFFLLVCAIAAVRLKYCDRYKQEGCVTYFYNTNRLTQSAIYIRISLY